MNITIKFKDGTTREFKHEARPGGGYTNSIKYEGGFAVVKTVWDVVHAFPAESVAEIITKPDRSW